MELSLNSDQIIFTILVRLLGAVVTLFIGRALAGLARRWAMRSLEKAGLTPSLITLLTTLSYYGILLLAVMVALVVIGVPTTTIVGAAGIVVVVLVIDLQQSLGNLAATVNFLLFKPFEVGDVIETGGMVGDDQVLEEPFPLVFVRRLDESNVVLAAWPFVPISVYLAFQKDIAERVKQGFDKAGVVIPRPQQEIHMVNVQQK